ncbi:PREDICTED: uncharacterized protein LOC108530090 [Rhinopithecus bieti]|uniref:uncharacterized protein LOC108530090 n=1 Tax=Rhinopithecus bieti TaxID=61621 RepID=UPI00083C368B|nr:PREDICTED: uncharacterized protein LOC108530090 [Rhinopithecus bieti]
MRRRGSQPLLSHVRSVAHRLTAQGPQISCLHSDLQVSAPAYCKLGAFLLQNPGALARKPRNFPSKESLATPGHRKVTNGQTRNEFQGGSTSPAHVVWGPYQGDRKAPQTEPGASRERPGCSGFILSMQHFLALWEAKGIELVESSAEKCSE